MSFRLLERVHALDPALFTDGQFRLLSHLAFLARDDRGGLIFARSDTMATRTGLAVAYVRLTLRGWQQLGVVEYVPQPARGGAWRLIIEGITDTLKSARDARIKRSRDRRESITCSNKRDHVIEFQTSPTAATDGPTETSAPAARAAQDLPRIFDQEVLEQRLRRDPVNAHSTRWAEQSKVPADDGNYRVLLKLAHQVLDELGLTDPTDPEATATLKDRCAELHVVYDSRMVGKTLEAAAVARLLPARRAGGGLQAQVQRLREAETPEQMGAQLRALASVRPRR